MVELPRFWRQNGTCLQTYCLFMAQYASIPVHEVIIMRARPNTRDTLHIDLLSLLVLFCRSCHSNWNVTDYFPYIIDKHISHSTKHANRTLALNWRVYRPYSCRPYCDTEHEGPTSIATVRTYRNTVLYSERVMQLRHKCIHIKWWQQ